MPSDMLADTGRTRRPIRLPSQIGAPLLLYHAIRAVLPAMLLAVSLLVLAGIGPTWPAVAADSPRPAAIAIVALGDSLTAGFRLPPEAAFPVKLARALLARGHRVNMANAGVSGDTTKAGLERVDWAVPDGTDLVILELGANDALRGLPPEATHRNLDAIITRLKAKGATVLLAGMRAPRNWGDDYVKRFEAIYPALAATHGVALYPFFLEGVATRPGLNLDDGMHPNEAGVDAIVAAILPTVEQALAAVAAKRAR